MDVISQTVFHVLAKIGDGSRLRHQVMCAEVEKVKVVFKINKKGCCLSFPRNYISGELNVH